MEKTITNKIIKALKLQGFWTVKIHGGQYQRAGLPDILAIKDGLSYWIEVKSPGKKPTPLQTQTIKELQNAGCAAGVATSVEEAFTICKLQIFSKS